MNATSEYTFTVKHIKASSIYRLQLIGFGISLSVLSLICGIMGMFGFNTVTINHAPIHGFLALPASIFLGMIMVLIFTGIFGSLCCLGLWIYSRFHPLKNKIVELGQ